MNKTAKILMLTVAIVVAIVAVLYFAKRIVAPPIQTSFPNAHLASLDSDIARLDQHLSMEMHAFFSVKGLLRLKRVTMSSPDSLNNTRPSSCKVLQSTLPTARGTRTSILNFVGEPDCSTDCVCRKATRSPSSPEKSMTE